MTVTPEATETQSLLERQPTDHRESPRSWSTPKKAAILGVVSFAVFNDAVGTGIVNPGASQIVREFQIKNPAVIPFLISVHVIGMAIGPLIVSPASELWGRCPLMHISNILLMASLAMGALSTNITILLVARVITGMAGCIPIVLEGGFIADLVAAEKRGKIIAIWALAPVSGSAIGPIVAGELTLRLGWRSAFWAMFIVAAVQTLVAMFILRETSDPSVLRKPAKSEDAGSNRWGAFVTAFARPVKLATLSPVVILSALKMSMAYVIFYILMSDLPILFGDKYDFDSSQIGYCYISPTIGAVFGFTILGGLADRVFQKRTVKRGMSKPQDRLAIMSFEVLLIAVGILAYGWSAQAQMHWIIPLLGANLTMVGSSGVVVSLQQYLTDYFGPHVPGAIAVCTVLRSVLGSALPSTIPALFDRLGYGWGSSVLAAAVLLFCPITSLLNRFEGYYENAQMY